MSEHLEEGIGSPLRDDAARLALAWAAYDSARVEFEYTSGELHTETELDSLRANVEAAIRAESAPLFEVGSFTLHSGEQSAWKVECDALTPADWDGLATIAASYIESASDVIGVPRGGLPFAEALKRVLKQDDAAPVLVVDDVLTTGGSLREVMEQHPGSRGIVAFARGPVPSNVTALWSAAGMNPLTELRGTLDLWRLRLATLAIRVGDPHAGAILDLGDEMAEAAKMLKAAGLNDSLQPEPDFPHQGGANAPTDGASSREASS